MKLKKALKDTKGSVYFIARETESGEVAAFVSRSDNRLLRAEDVLEVSELAGYAMYPDSLASYLSTCDEAVSSIGKSFFVLKFETGAEALSFLKILKLVDKIYDESESVSSALDDFATGLMQKHTLTKAAIARETGFKFPRK